VAPGLHRFVFPSQSRGDLVHELMLDLHATGPARLSCLCEASLYGRMCKHKRFVILAFSPHAGRGPRAWRWTRVRPRSGRNRRKG
jgi:hypothetical protein